MRTQFARQMTDKQRWARAPQRSAGVSLKKIDVVRTEEKYVDAVKGGAYGVFNADSDDQIVSIYTIDGVDKQICGGPHAKNTGDLGTFVIKKEESSSSGVRRIKAILK